MGTENWALDLARKKLLVTLITNGTGQVPVMMRKACAQWVRAKMGDM